MKTTARIVYEKYCNGDKIGDTELGVALHFFTDLERDLRQLGPEFLLAANEATRVRISLQGFYDARNSKLS